MLNAMFLLLGKLKIGNDLDVQKWEMVNKSLWQVVRITVLKSREINK